MILNHKGSAMECRLWAPQKKNSMVVYHLLFMNSACVAIDDLPTINPHDKYR